MNRNLYIEMEECYNNINIDINMYDDTSQLTV